eukprot:1886580-Prymnesium_polylepis.1
MFVPEHLEKPPRRQLPARRGRSTAPSSGRARWHRRNSRRGSLDSLPVTQRAQVLGVDEPTRVDLVRQDHGPVVQRTDVAVRVEPARILVAMVDGGALQADGRVVGAGDLVALEGAFLLELE